jgi:hypothetical protein
MAAPAPHFCDCANTVKRTGVPLLVASTAIPTVDVALAPVTASE